MSFRPLVPVVVAALAACTTAPKPPAAPAPVAAQPAPATPSSKYYSDDGPPLVVTIDLDAVPDAVPRNEPLHRFANRPYTVLGRDYVPATSPRPYRERGVASWYGRKFHGQKTSIGEVYDMFAMTAAHPTMPLPSYARVTSVASGKSVVVRVNDRGPFLHGRVMDLSYAAAHRLGIAQKGSGEVLLDDGWLATAELQSPSLISPGEFRRLNQLCFPGAIEDLADSDDEGPVSRGPKRKGLRGGQPSTPGE